MKTFLVLAFISQFAYSQSVCPEGWTIWKDEKCYIFHANFQPFEAAKQVCVSVGSVLATIKEEAQQTFLDNFIHNESGIEDEVWLGATRVSKTEFQWEDGTPLHYNNWAADNPSEIEGRDCVVMQSRTSKLPDPEGTWRDASCTSPKYFVCEIDPVWSPKELQKVLVETRKKQQNLLENPVPIGFIYTQLPGQPVPSSLWPNIKWTEISSQFAGKFFRVVGGAAGAFGTTQNADSPRLTGAKYTQLSTNNESPVTITPGTWSRNLRSGRNEGKMVDHLNFFVSNSEVRPINTSMRIWVRES